MKKLSIVLTDAGYRERFHFLDCLSEQTFDDFQVVWCDFYGKISDVVKNKSKVINDMILLSATDRKDVNSDTLYNEAKAINYAIKKSDAEIIMKIDADLFVKNDFLEKVIDMHKDNDKLITSGIDKREKGNIGDRPFEWGEIKKRSCITNLTNYGSCLTTRKEHLMACNGWDEDDIWNGVHFPSKDMGWRLINYGLSQRWYFDPPSLHPWHPSHHNFLWEIKDLSQSALHKFGGGIISPTHKQKLDKLIVDRVENGIYYVFQGIDKIED